MKANAYVAIAVGTAIGLFIIWGAAFSALSAGGLVLVAAMLDGLMAGIGIGGLIGLNIAFGAALEEKEAGAVPPEVPKAA